MGPALVCALAAEAAMLIGAAERIARRSGPQTAPPDRCLRRVADNVDLPSESCQGWAEIAPTSGRARNRSSDHNRV